MATLLGLLEYHDPSPIIPLFLCPFLCHLLKIAADLERGLGREDGIRIAVSRSTDRCTSG
jgi:hypothetical protein